MTPGLVNSVIHCAVLPPAGPVIQAALFQDDTVRLLAEKDQQIREGESAYQKLSDSMTALEAENRRLRQENACKDLRLDIYRKLVVCGQPGRVVR